MNTVGIIRNRAGERIDFAFHSGENAGKLVILGHGVTGSKSRPLLVEIADELSARGWPCLRLSFSGNGKSGGKFEDCTITKESEDLQDVLETVPDFVKIAYIGHSMGGAVGVVTAAKDLRISTLISLAGMTDTAGFVRREFSSLTPGKDVMWEEPTCPFSVAFADDLNAIENTLGHASGVPQPWLLVHGDADDVVPPQDSVDAHAAAPGVKKLVIVPGGDHQFDGVRHVAIEEIDSWLKANL